MAPSPESVAAFEKTMIFCFFTICCWDWVINLSNEWEFIWKRPGWNMAKTLYIFERYFGLTTFVLLVCLVAIDWTSKQCNFWSRFVPYLCIFVVLGTQLILLLRLRAIWEGNIWITAVFGSLLLIELILNHIIIFKTVAPLWVPKPSQTTGFCVGTDGKKPGTIPLSVISLYPAAVDTVITALTMYKVALISKEYGYRSTMLRDFKKHGLIAFVTVTLVQITNAVFILQPVKSLQALFNPNMNFVAQIMGCRLILSLYQQRKEASLSIIQSAHPPDIPTRNKRAVNRTSVSGDPFSADATRQDHAMEPIAFRVDDFKRLNEIRTLPEHEKPMHFSV